MNISDSSSWHALTAHYTHISNTAMRDLFQRDTQRAQRFSCEANGIYLDYSKNRIVDETLRLLVGLADEASLSDAIGAMFNGERINFTEQRAVLHTALRNQGPDPVLLDGQDVRPGVLNVLDRLRGCSETLHTGAWLGYDGKPLKDIVHIGIGGSHLGPMMVCHALSPFARPRLNVHFVSNVDGNDIHSTLHQVDPSTTLFIIASKTFTTQETMTNAETAKAWFLNACQDPSHVANHFLAVSTNITATSAFGIAEDKVFEFWDWVGGRYSLWSAIGLPVILYIGMENFQQLLAGANAMDEHFRGSTVESNLPTLLALLGLWYNNFFKTHNHAVIPYDERLKYLPAYLQQLDMESNGKGIDRKGLPVPYATGPIIWGNTGTDSQHAFFQSLHQGTQLIPTDFIFVLNPHHPYGNHHAILAANCFAQSEALMRGKTADEVRQELSASGMEQQKMERLTPHKVFAGNKPSNTIILEDLMPFSLGALLAMYEHKVFVQGTLWNINSFDQWGVELGKQLAKKILVDFEDDSVSGHDASTAALIQRFKHAKLQS